MRYARRFGWLGLLALVGCVSGAVRKEEDVVQLAPRTPKPMEARKRVAVVDFVDKTDYGRGRLGTGAADILTTYLVKSQQFRVFERLQISKAMDELKLQGSGVVDAATAAKIGKMVGADYVVYGAVTNFGLRTEGTDVILYQGKHQVAESTVDVRMIHVETSEVLYAETGRGSATRSTSGSLGLGGRMSFDETLSGDSLRAAIVKMMDQLIDSAP